MQAKGEPGAGTGTVESDVDAVVARPREAQERIRIASADQATPRSRRALAVGLGRSWSPNANAELSRLAVDSTGLGRVDRQDRGRTGPQDARAAAGTCRARARRASMRGGPRARDHRARCVPVGVVGAIVPSTNPAATPGEQRDQRARVRQRDRAGAVAGRRSRCARRSSRFDARGELERVRARPGSGADARRAARVKAKTAPLAPRRSISSSSTGSQDNVRRAYQSGHAGARGRIGQRDRHRRRGGGPGATRRGQDRRVQDLRQCDLVLVGEPADRRRSRCATRLARGAARRGRTPVAGRRRTRQRVARVPCSTAGHLNRRT